MTHKNKPPVLAVAFAAILFAAAACSSVVNFRWSEYSGMGLAERDEISGFELECPEGIDTLTARIEVTLSAGAFRWKIRDPDGEVQWTGEARETTEDRRSLTPVTGDWRVEFELEGFTGNYCVGLRAEGNN